LFGLGKRVVDGVHGRERDPNPSRSNFRKLRPGKSSRPIPMPACDAILCPSGWCVKPSASNPSFGGATRLKREENTGPVGEIWAFSLPGPGLT
jgi:hypothetical protein